VTSTLFPVHSLDVLDPAHQRDRTLPISRTFALPLDVVTETIAILGLRGSGKTNTATVIAEGLLALGQQVVVVDPTDAWYGLKSSADGKAEGFPVVILGGRHGDIPLGAEHGALAADFVVERGASVICSLRHFESKGEQRRFVTDFCNRLYHRKGEAGRDTPLMLMIDEASLFVPQRVMGEDTRMVAAIQRLVRQGRSSGFGVTLIDQRASTVNKDVLTQIDCLIVHRTTAPQDRKALEAWIEQHDVHGQRGQFLASLASLARGVAWLWSPGWLDLFQMVEVRPRATFDSSRTPKPGERVIAPQRVATVDLDALRSAFAEVVAQAEADDPKALRKRIAELERQAALSPAAAAPASDEELREAWRRGVLQGRAEQHRLLRRRLAEIEGAIDTIAAANARAHTAIETLNAESPDIGPDASIDLVDMAAVERLSRGPNVVPLPSGWRVGGELVSAEVVADLPLADRAIVPVEIIGHDMVRDVPFRFEAEVPRDGAVARMAARADAVARPPKDHEGRVELGSTPRKMLDAMAILESLGIPEPSRVNVAGWVGISAKTGTFRNYLSELRSAGAIEDRPGLRLALTAKGRRMGQVPPLLPTLRELHETWASKLGGTTAKMLHALVKAHPRALSREALARTVGIDHSTGTFRNYLSELRSPGLIIDVSRTEVKASDLLFPPGLR